MPIYAVVIVGSGIKIPSDDSDPATGFFATRIVQEKNEESAILEAKKIILRDWESDGLQGANVGGKLKLEVDSIKRVNFLDQKFSKMPYRGYTFFCN